LGDAVFYSGYWSPPAAPNPRMVCRIFCLDCYIMGYLLTLAGMYLFRTFMSGRSCYSDPMGGLCDWKKFFSVAFFSSFRVMRKCLLLISMDLRIGGDASSLREKFDIISSYFF